MDRQVDVTDVVDAEAAFDEGAVDVGARRAVPVQDEVDGMDDDGADSVEAVDADGDAVDDGVDVSDPAVGDRAGAAPAADPLDGGWEEKYRTLEKRLHDNQAWATRVAQENAALKAKDGGEKPQAKADPPAEDIPPEVKAYYESDPDLKKVVEYEAQRLVKARFGEFDPRVVEQRLSETQARLEQGNFERSVLYGVVTPGGFVKGHPDALEVMSSPDYQQWFQAESQRDSSILTISDPVQAIGIMDRYKTRVAEAAAQKQQEAQAAQKTQMTDMMSGAVDKGTRSADSKRGPKADPSPEEAFDEGIK